MARHDQKPPVIKCLGCGKGKHEECLNLKPHITRLCDCTCVPKEPEYHG